MRLIAALLVSAALASAAPFPTNAGQIDVTTSPYNATPGTFTTCSGSVDATTAIQNAIFSAGRGQIVYLPAGCFLVSETLWEAVTFSGSVPPSNLYGKAFTQIFGAGQGLTKIKVANSSTNFQSATGCGTPGVYFGYVTAAGGGGTNCRAVIYQSSVYSSMFPPPTYGGGEDAYMNTIQDLTIEIGTNNPGAMCIDSVISNDGAIRNVTCQMDDNTPLYGIVASRLDDGPGYVQNVIITGGQYGILSGEAHSGYSQPQHGLTWETISLSGQSVMGWINFNSPQFINGLTSSNSVPAFQNNGLGRITLVNGSLSGGSGSVSAFNNNTANGVLFLRNLSCPGYMSCLVNNGSVVAGTTISESTAGKPVITKFPSIGTSLNLPINQAPTFSDSNFSADWADVTSATYGSCAGGGTVDCTSAIQAAMNSGRPVVYFPFNFARGYLIKGTVTIPSTVRLVELMGNCITTSSTSWCNSEHGPASTTAIFTQSANANTIIENFEMDESSTGPITYTGATGTFTLRDSLRVQHPSFPCTGACQIYMEDAANVGYAQTNGSLWYHQTNVENTGTHIDLNGVTAWLLGMKTEGAVTTSGGTCTATTCGLIYCHNGSTCELLGGWFYTTTTNMGTMIVMSNSQMSAAGFGSYPGGFNATTEESRAGSAFKPYTDTSWDGGGVGVALYSGNTYSNSSGPPPNCGTPSMTILVLQCQVSFAPSGTASSLTISFPAAVQAGSALLAYGGYFNATPTTMAVTDTIGNSYTALTQQTATSGSVLGGQLFRFCNTPGGSDAITLAFPGATSFPVVQALEVNGLAAGCVNASSSSSSTTATATSGSMTTTTASLVIGFLNSFSVPTGAAVGFKLIDNPTNPVSSSEYQLQGSAGAITSTFPISGSGPYLSVMTQIGLIPLGSTTVTGSLIMQ